MRAPVKEARRAGDGAVGLCSVAGSMCVRACVSVCVVCVGSMPCHHVPVRMWFVGLSVSRVAVRLCGVGEGASISLRKKLRARVWCLRIGAAPCCSNAHQASSQRNRGRVSCGIHPNHGHLIDSAAAFAGTAAAGARSS